MRFFRNSLFWKGSFFIFASSILALGTFGIIFSGYITRQFYQQTEEFGNFLLATVQNGLFTSMVHRDKNRLQDLLEELSRYEYIRQVTITKTGGEPYFSARRGRIYNIDLPSDMISLAKDDVYMERHQHDGESFLMVAKSVANESRCHGCHPADQAKLGNIGLEISLRKIERFTVAGRLILLFLMALLVSVLMAVNMGFLNRFIVYPLKELSFKIRQVEKGQKGILFSDVTGDEIDDLERSFGSMVRVAEEHHQRELERSKQMALMVQDLKHQMEITAVNTQLENRLKDLDVANKKINRLAERLEEKNINLQKMVKKVSALNRLGVALSSELEMSKVIRLVINVAIKGLRAERGFLMLLDEKNHHLRLSFGMGLGEEYDQSLPVEVGDSISGLVAGRGEAILIADIAEDGRFKRISRYGFLRKSVICAPLKVKDHILGTIELTNKKGEENFNEDDLEMLVSICSQAAIAIDNAMLMEKIQKSYLDTIRALIQAIEEKDLYTRGHSERVTLFSVKIAEMMGLDQRRLDILKYAGYLHDIGKIGIDINILQKKGKLDEAEYNLVKNHPLIGERIIAPIEFLQDVRNCISQHHERYDGFGYPCGVCGKNISLEARILGVADAYDAMITDRPYRKALSKEVAVAELRRCSGTQFDPEAVEMFLEVLDSDQEILELEKRLSTVGT